MRKLIWCCSAAAVLATGSLLSLAYYACRCPDSIVGHSMQVIAAASIAIQPLSGLTALAVRTNQAVAAGHDTTPPIEECIPDEPQPVAPERKEEDVFGDRLHEVEADAAPIVIVEDDPMPREVKVTVNDRNTGSIEFTGMGGQEVPPKGGLVRMPYCRDDEDEAVPTMPHADAGEETEPSVFKAWRELFEEGKEAKEDKSPAVEQLPPPTEEEPQTEPKCQEDSHLHEQYPGCPRTTSPYRDKNRVERYYKRPWDLDPNFNSFKKKGSEESSEEPPHHDKDKEARPRTKGVDTMEYRKSDAGLDEYGPGPLH